MGFNSGFKGLIPLKADGDKETEQRKQTIANTL